MKPQAIISDRVGSLAAKAVLSDLDKAGFVIVDKGAVGRAQREAVMEYRADLKLNDHQLAVKAFARKAA